jgi:hypothetical protein
VERYELDLSDPREGPVVGVWEHHKEPSVSIKLRQGNSWAVEWPQASQDKVS